MADKTQHIMWTALPNGYAERLGYKVSVLVSPELTLTPALPHTLEEFPDFVDWPETLSKVKFTFTYHNAVIENPQLVSSPDSKVWKSVFPKSTFVRSHQFEDRRGTIVLSYPLNTVYNFVRQTYATLVSEAGEELPERSDHFRNVRKLVEKLPEPKDILTALRDPEIQLDPDDLRTAWALLQAYHRPLSAEEKAYYIKNTSGSEEDPREDAKWRTHRLVKLPEENKFRDLIDFHQIVSSTNQYHGLLRKLGLVLDFILPEDKMPDVAMTERIRVCLKWVPTTAAVSGVKVKTLDDTRPFTVTRLEPQTAFRPVNQDASTPVIDGYLELADRFRLMQIDVDGAGIKTKNFAQSLVTMRGAATREPEPRVGAPALQTGGIMLVEPKRASMLSKAIDRSGKLFDAETAGGDVELFQEDLIRGYHTDILDVDKNEWQSLCRRDGLIDLVDTFDDVAVENEEGPVRLGVTQAADGENPDVVKLYEGIFAWNGWSLSAPPPGRGVPVDDDASQAEDLSNKAPIGMTFQANFTVRKGSLPSLRYGRTYRMRVRVCDLALNAKPWTTKDVHPKQAASPPLTYRRFEPVEPPAFALGRTGGVVEKPGAGESMNRIAIRTFNDTPAGNTEPIKAKARRHVVASRTSVKQAETHGNLDDATGKLDPATYKLLATRDAALESVKLNFDGVDQDYAVANDGFTLPYLPDPFAEKVALKFMGPASVGLTTLPDVLYYPTSAAADWPDALPFQIVIQEDPGAKPKFDAASRILTVSLAKADIVRLRLSHVLPKGGLEQMGVWQWFLERFGSNQQLVAAVKALALAGGNWTVTPWTEIELIHAVQKPLVAPEIQKLFISRTLGTTYARLNFSTPVDTHSTDKLDLFGRWNEPQDPLTELGPRSVIRRGHAHERKLDYSEAPGMAPSGKVDYMRIKHEFGDTRYRRILYRLEATSRFREFMPPAIREPLVAGETNPQIKVVSDEVTGWVPNSAPPPAPEILYVMPTFGWTRRKTAGAQTSWRDGGGLRIYLNRPWFVSGHNEMLAVILPSDSATRLQIDKELKSSVTQWGTDPIWGSTNISTPSPGLAVFPMAVKQGPLDPARLPAFVPDEEADLPAGVFNMGPLVNPTLPASSKLRVNVVPHMVDYDSDRQLWYCDIVVDPGRSYYPFIRLALARYHPISAPGAHISPIVTTEFVQLTPDRLASVAPSGRGSFTVGLYGYAYAKGPAAPRSSGATGSAQKPIVVVTVEQLDESLGPDFGWKTLKTATVTEKRARGGIRLRTRTTALRASTGASASLARRANDLLAARNFTSILANPQIVELLRPPAIWEGTATLPAQGIAGKSLRLAFREYERHGIDSDHISIPDGAPDPSLRLVYAEFIKLA